jgi:hypothetical protein
MNHYADYRRALASSMLRAIADQMGRHTGEASDTAAEALRDATMSLWHG